ncbi:hypothetical protein F2Q69_00048667 [Brassica cretica]|uniref:Uncharacterized protein n=1 Tax=Brassica cretica TaxID=69181 RepID=A0A8S9PZZ3_BRACR|nr:hypothetical protein F2Q69_00048667 [Brassica cretica]
MQGRRVLPDTEGGVDRHCRPLEAGHQNQPPELLVPQALFQHRVNLIVRLRGLKPIPLNEKKAKSLKDLDFGSTPSILDIFGGSSGESELDGLTCRPEALVACEQERQGPPQLVFHPPKAGRSAFNACGCSLARYEGADRTLRDGSLSRRECKMRDCYLLRSPEISVEVAASPLPLDLQTDSDLGDGTLILVEIRYLVKEISERERLSSSDKLLGVTMDNGV